jgi:adenylylsulfate kinase-like enzyme
MKKKINSKKGILFWVTGLSGSGKTVLAKKIKNRISKIYGPTLIISGDDIRNVFKLKGYSYNDRLQTVKKYCKLSKLITSQKINVIFAVIGLMDEIRLWNKKNIENYIEIYVKSDITTIIKKRRKRVYKTSKKNIVGIDIKPEFPKKPDIIIKNYFKNDLNKLSSELLNKIQKSIY